MRAILWFLVLILAAGISYALDVDIYSAGFHIVEDKAVVDIDISFEETTEVFEFRLPEDYEALDVYVDDNLAISDIEDSTLKINLENNSKISFSYVTEEFIDKTNFLMNMKLDFDVNSLLIKLVLPKGATLKKPIKEGDLTSGSIYPKPDKSSTDGQSPIFYWLKEDAKKGDEISIFAQIQPKRNYSWLIFVVFVLVVIVLYIVTRKPKTKVIVAQSKTRTIVRKQDMVEKHLKEDEEQIVNILKKREGACEQGTLRVITGFSKASLSRLLKELEDRKVVHKEKRGKKNLVFLKK